MGLSYKRKRGPTGACNCLGSKVMPDPTHNSRTLDSRGNTSLVALAARATALMRASSIFQTLLSPLFFVRSRFHSEVFLSPNPCPSPVFRARCFACFRQPKARKLSAGSLLVGSHASFSFACFLTITFLSRFSTDRKAWINFPRGKAKKNSIV